MGFMELGFIVDPALGGFLIVGIITLTICFIWQKKNRSDDNTTNYASRGRPVYT